MHRFKMDGVRLEWSSASLTACFYKEDMLGEGTSAKKSSFSAEELDDEELSRMEDCRPVRLCVHT